MPEYIEFENRRIIQIPNEDKRDYYAKKQPVGMSDGIGEVHDYRVVVNVSTTSCVIYEAWDGGTRDQACLTSMQNKPFPRGSDVRKFTGITNISYT